MIQLLHSLLGAGETYGVSLWLESYIYVSRRYLPVHCLGETCDVSPAWIRRFYRCASRRGIPVMDLWSRRNTPVSAGVYPGHRRSISECCNCEEDEPISDSRRTFLNLHTI